MTLFKITALTLATALPGLAVAQTATTTTTPATATEPATTATTVTGPLGASTTVTVPATTTVVVTLAGITEDDAAITAKLTEAGYKDIKIARDGGKLNIDATKDGTATNMVYDLSSGALTTVDGAGYTVDTLAPGMQTGETGNTGKTDANGATDAPEAGGSTDGGATDGGSTEGGATDGGSTDGGSTEGPTNG